MTEKKTYKREVAGGLIAFVVGLTFAGIWYPAAGEAAESLKWETFSFAALAFGLDAWGKQIAR